MGANAQLVPEWLILKELPRISRDPRLAKYGRDVTSGCTLNYMVGYLLRFYGSFCESSNAAEILDVFPGSSLIGAGFPGSVE